jgi:hypothetical protein
MSFVSIGRTLAGLIVLLFATSAEAVGPHQFDAIQFLDAAILSPSQIATATCSSSGATLTCTSLVGTIVVGMAVADLTTTTHISPQTIVSGVAGGTITITNTATTFTADTIEFIGQQINDQLGTSWSFSGTPYNALNWELSAGTSGGPVTTGGPLVKISKIEAITPAAGNAGCNGNALDNTCNAALLIASTGLGGATGDGMQNVAIYAVAESSQTVCATCNATAGRFQSRLTGSNPMGKPSAANFIVENNATFGSQADFNMSGIKGFELDDNNNSGTNCPSVSYNSSGSCDGAEWIICNGSNTCGPAIHIGDGSIAWDEGITINNGAINSTGGYSFNDQSSAGTSINIGGTHSTAAINVASGAGPVYLGSGTVDLNANSASLPAAQTGTLVQIANADTTPTRSAPGEACLATAPSGSTTLANSLCQHNDGGITVGSATDEGAGTLNAVTLYQGGTALGTAATANTGTSGATIPLLNGTNTWSGVQTYGAGDFVLSGATNGDIGSFNASHALQDSGTLLSSLAPLASPTFTGTATLPDGTSCTSSGCTIGQALSLGSHQINSVTAVISNASNGYELNSGAAHATVPTFSPNRSDTNAGVGANSATNVSLIVDVSGTSTEVLRASPSGIQLEYGAYYSGGTAGVTCSGSPTASFASTNGIVTHC